MSMAELRSSESDSQCWLLTTDDEHKAATAAVNQRSSFTTQLRPLTWSTTPVKKKTKDAKENSREGEKIRKKERNVKSEITISKTPASLVVTVSVNQSISQSMHLFQVKNAKHKNSDTRGDYRTGGLIIMYECQLSQSRAVKLQGSVTEMKYRSRRVPRAKRALEHWTVQLHATPEHWQCCGQPHLLQQAVLHS